MAGGEKEKSSGGDPWDALLHDVKRGKPKGRLHTQARIAPGAGAETGALATLSACGYF